MKAKNVYKIKIFQALIFMYSFKSETVPLIYQDLFTIKPRNKYTIRPTNMLKEVLCWRKFSYFKIPCRGSHLWNKLIVPNNAKNFIPFKRKLKGMIVSIQNVIN